MELGYHIIDAIFDLDKEAEKQKNTPITVKPIQNNTSKLYPANLDFAVVNKMGFKPFMHNALHKNKINDFYNNMEKRHNNVFEFRH